MSPFENFSYINVQKGAICVKIGLKNSMIKTYDLSTNILIYFDLLNPHQDY